MPIRVIVADDDPLVRDALSVLFSRDPDFEFLGSASGGREAVALARSAGPEVALVDVRMPGGDGIAATADIVREMGCKVLVLTTFREEDLVRGAIKAGASGYLLKGCGTDEIKAAVKLAKAGISTFQQDAFDLVRGGAETSTGDLSALSERERELVALIAEGYSNHEAAVRMNLSEGTVKNYITSILDKLGLRQRTQIAIYALSGRKDFS